VLSGDEDGGIAISAFQASNSAVEMIKADIVEPSADPSVMLVRSEEEDDGSPSKTRYIPEVFYRRINEYGASVQNAKPSFLSSTYWSLYVRVSTESNPLFNSPGFSIENREIIGESQELRTVTDKLGVRGSNGRMDPEGGLKSISDFHLLCFLHGMGILTR
jgi:nuclear protein localization family protein 4